MTEPDTPLVSRWQALQRRELVRWLLAYLAGAWLLLQVLQLLAGVYGWPPVVLRLATGVLAIGALLTAVLAWYHGERGEQRITRAELSILTVLLAVGGGLLWLVERQRPSPAPVASATPSVRPIARADSRLRIAVLPIRNLSPDPANAFFADGLHEELLGALSRIGALDVVSRTTMQSYRDSGKTISAIAGEVGATHVLEGSVRREGDRVRLSMQLADNADAKLWSEDYDRTLTDALGLQSEVSNRVADALALRLSAQTRRALATAPTGNVQAYDNYLQARLIDRNAGYSAEQFADEERLLDAALALDPKFVAALTLRARMHLLVFWYGQDISESRLRKARADIDRAHRLAFDSADVAYAEALYVYWGQADYPRALKMLHAVEQRVPNDAQVQEVIAYLLRRVGDLEGADRILERLTTLDPNNVVLWSVYLDDLVNGRRRYQEARALSDRLLLRFPEQQWFLSYRMQAEFNTSNDLRAYLRDCAALVATMPRDQARMLQFGCAYYGGDLAAWGRALDALPGDTVANAGGFQYPLALTRAYRDWLQGRHAQARSGALSIQAGYLPALEGQTRGRNRYRLHQVRAEMHALAGEPDQATAEIARALALMPLEKDALFGADLLKRAAFVAAVTGQRDRAVTVIEQALTVPGGFHAAEVLHDPLLAKALAGDPRWPQLRQRLQAGFRR